MTKKLLSQKKAEKKIDGKCSECKDKATGIIDTILYCAYHYRLKKYNPEW